MAREKWSKARVLEEFQILHKKWKTVPTKRKMIRMGYKKLAQYAIPKYFESFKNLHAALGIPNSRKPPEYWTLKNTLDGIREFCLANKKLIEDTSFSKALIITKMFALANAIRKHGRIRTLNKKYKLGISLRSRKWTKAKIIRDLKEIYQAGNIMTQENLIKMGRNDLIGAIHKRGSLDTFKKAAGIPVKKLKRWTESKIIKELKPIIAEYHFFPSATILKAIGRNDLISAMSKHGGFPRFSKLLNKPLRTLFPANDGHYLQSSYECIFDNILFKYHVPHRVHVRISKKHLYKCDFLIGETYIEIAGYHRTNSNAYEIKMEKKIQLYKQLKKKHIILPQKLFCQRIEWIEQEVVAMLKKIPFDPKKLFAYPKDICIKPGTYWADFKNVKAELSPYIQKYGRMPTIKELYKNNNSSLANAIYKYHGTTYDIAQRLKLKSRQVSQEYYSRKKAIDDYKQLCISHKKYLTLKELYSLNLRGLAHAIIKYKGFQVIRRACRLGYSLRRVRPREYSHENTILEYKGVCKKYGRFLTRQELVANGLSRLAGYLNRHGLGINAAREKTGLNFITPYLPRGYYTLSQVVKTYKQQCQKYGYFLTRREALMIISPKMIGFIDRYIGYKELRKLTKLKW